MAKKPAQRKARVSTVPENETKAAKFKRLGEFRLSKALKSISAIGNLSGVGYEYTGEQRDKIEETLRAAVTGVMVRFAKDGSGTASGGKAPAVTL